MFHHKELRGLINIKTRTKIRKHGLFINESGTSLDKFEVDTEDEVLILIGKYYGNADGNDRKGESPILIYHKRVRMERNETEQKLKSQNLTIRLYHGKLNPLPSTWNLPKGTRVIKLINTCIICSKKESIKPSRYLVREIVKHNKNYASILSKMIQFTKNDENFGQDEEVWILKIPWIGLQVTTFWYSI